MTSIIQRLTHFEQLSKEEAKKLLIDISQGEFNANSIAVLLTVFMMRPITIDELEGFRDALLETCIKVDFSEYETIDLCGTGGDGKHTFNISTLASLVVAGSGIMVTKHGNYGVSSISGSSNVLEQLGVKFSNEQDFLKRCLEEGNICILHAPLFHPAMKNVAPIRRDLGLKTFFNMLGPMINPSQPKNQLVGVFDLELMRIYGYTYQKSDKNFTIIHSLSGHDEISLTTDCKYISNDAEGIIKPSDFGFNYIQESEIAGGSSQKKSAEIFLEIINGNGTEAQNNVVCANAAVAISTIKKIPLSSAVEQAQESLKMGWAKQSLNKLIQLSK